MPVRVPATWSLTLTAAGAYPGPADLLTAGPASPCVDSAPVPGTVAHALTLAADFDREAPRSLDDVDAWYTCSLDAEPGAASLVFDGLATVCEVYLNGELVLTSRSMYQRHVVPVVLQGGDELALCFRALGPHLSAKAARPRWHQQLFVPRGVKNVRTTLLGRMPGWAPEVHAVGPWRPIQITRPTDVTDVRLSPGIDEHGTAVLSVSLTGPADGCSVRCLGVEQPLVRDGHRWTSTLTLPDAERWWPHTHGAPTLYDIELVTGGRPVRLLGRTGFRSVRVDRGQDGRGFTLTVNDVPVFCRGAVWTNADIVRLPGDRSAYEPLLQLARDAGVNMLRVGGTMAYETRAFFELCDELGILVWQDAMLANFDYPADESFLDLVRDEADNLLGRVSTGSPSLAVLCGGSEVFQQAAMTGRPAEYWAGPIYDDVLPDAVARLRPDVAYVPNSPSGGPMPFSPGHAVSHYYGVGAYKRPLEDARRADVRFASECLAFAHVPQGVDTIDDIDRGVPADRGADWDFADTRDFYLGLLFGEESAALRATDPARYVHLSQAVTGEVLEATIAEWRRPASRCGGALIWNYSDLWQGSGWGVVDVDGQPKPTWYAMRRAFRSVQVSLTDEGTNGLDVHVLNDTAAALDLEVELLCLRGGEQVVFSGSETLRVPGHSGVTRPATDLFGHFVDTTYAFRFGPPTHDVVVARLRRPGVDEPIAESFWFPLGRAAAVHEATVDATVTTSAGRWTVELTTDKLAQSVHLVVPGHRPADDWFHLAPGAIRRIPLLPRDAAGTTGPPPVVSVRQLRPRAASPSAQ